MAIDRSMRLPDLAQNGSISVGDLIDAIKAEVMPAVTAELLPAIMTEVEARVLADLRALLAGAAVRPTGAA